MIYGNAVGGNGVGIGSTFIIEDENGKEVVGVVTDNEIVFNATPNDIRIGKVAATQEGIVVGEKDIPPYYTNAGYKLIPHGSKFFLTTKDYDYTKLQAILCQFNTSVADSVAASRVVIEDNVYPVQSIIALAQVTKNEKKTRIDFGLTNDTGMNYIIRYFMYKEVY